MLRWADAGCRRISESLSRLCRDQARLGQSDRGRTRVACRNVCPAPDKGVCGAAELAGDRLDDRLGGPRLYLRAVRNVEAPPRSDRELGSTRPALVAATSMSAAT